MFNKIYAKNSNKQLKHWHKMIQAVGKFMKLFWKPNDFQTVFILSKHWCWFKPAVKWSDCLTHLTALSLPDLSKATSELRDLSSPVNTLHPLSEHVEYFLLFFKMCCVTLQHLSKMWNGLISALTKSFFWNSCWFSIMLKSPCLMLEVKNSESLTPPVQKSHTPSHPQ